jgi:hypothetical protein
MNLFLFLTSSSVIFITTLTRSRRKKRLHLFWLINNLQEDEPPFQDVLEAKYLHNRERRCYFEREGGKQTYLIDFVAMKQINVNTGYKRDICRRPMFSPDGLKPYVYCFSLKCY